MGHGAGGKYINHNQLDKLQNLETVVILMGRASAKLLSHERFGDRRKGLEGIIGEYISSDMSSNKYLPDGLPMVHYGQGR
jgi:hypothetical protein